MLFPRFHDGEILGIYLSIFDYQGSNTSWYWKTKSTGSDLPNMLLLSSFMLYHVSTAKPQNRL